MANTTIYPYGVAGMYDTVNDVFYSNANTLGFFVLDND